MISCLGKRFKLGNSLSETMYPIVFNIFEENMFLVDGGHRIKVAKLLGLNKIKALVGYDEPDWSEYNEKYDD